MKRNMLFGAGAAALACLLGGCRLAVPQGAAGQDTLIGGYATWESIPYFSEHFLSGDRSPARLYADWSSADRPEGAQWRNIFPNVTGYALCQNTTEEDGDTVYLGSGADPYFNGLAYNSAHNGSETTESMTGTLYADISQIRGDITGFTFSHQVYGEGFYTMELLVKAINKLNDREKMIICLRFGLNQPDGREKTQKEVADLLGISQSYISRLEKRIMVRLKKEIVRYE